MSDTITIVGQIKNILESKILGQNFELREFWIEEVDGQYPQTFLIQATQGKCNVLDNFELGDLVEVKCNLRGRYWSKPSEEGGVREGVMNSIQMWQIQKVAGGQPKPKQQFPTNPNYQAPPPQQQAPNNDHLFKNNASNQPDDLPF